MEYSYSISSLSTACSTLGIAVEAVEAYENGWKKTETSRIVTDALIAALELSLIHISW